MSVPLPFAYFRKEIVPFKDANISIGCHSMQYGVNCFGGMRGYFRDGQVHIFRLEDHYERLMNSAKLLEMPFFISYSGFKDIMVQLVRKNKPKSDFYIRPIIFTEDLSIGVFHGHNYEMSIFFMDIPYVDRIHSLNLMISTWKKFSDNAIPTKAKAGGGYLNTSLAKKEAKRLGFDDALMMDDSGSIVEGSSTNVFIVYKDEVYMPSTGEDLLVGITRRTLNEIMVGNGIKINYGKIDRSMVYTSDEVILTGTLNCALFAHAVDGRVICPKDTPGPVFSWLQEEYFKIIRGEHPKSKEWVTSIPL